MRWSILRRQFGFTAALLALLVAGCGGTGGSAPPGASTTLIVARDISVVVSLDPQQSYEQLTYDRAVYDTLVAFDRADTSKVVKSVADSWSTSSDGMTWTFHLRRGIRFASGNELTAADYIYSFQRIVNLPKNPAAWLVTQMGITADTVARQVVASDPYTLKITVTQPIAPGAFLDIMTFPTTAAIDSRVVKQHDVGGDLGHAWLDDHSAGSGPFILDRWDRASQIVLKGNPGYNLGPKPSLTRIVFKNVTESSSQFDLLQKGGADVALGLTHQQLSQLQGNSKYRVQRQPDLSLEYLGMNVKTVPAFGNPLVRQAIKYAIDYKGLAGQLMNGEVIQNQSIVPKGVAGYDSSLPYSQNIEKAKGLLQQAGYPDGFTFELLVQTSDINGVPSSDVVSKIKSDLARIGVTANPRQVQSSQLYTIMRAQQVQGMIGNWSADYPDPDDFAKPFGDYSQKSLAWRLGWDDPTLSQMAQKAGTLPNGPQRDQLYKQINDYAMQQSPFAILYQPLLRDAMSSQVHDFYDNPIFGLDMIHVRKQ